MIHWVRKCSNILDVYLDFEEWVWDSEKERKLNKWVKKMKLFRLIKESLESKGQKRKFMKFVKIWFV